MKTVSLNVVVKRAKLLCTFWYISVGLFRLLYRAHKGVALLMMGGKGATLVGCKASFISVVIFVVQAEKMMHLVLLVGECHCEGPIAFMLATREVPSTCVAPMLGSMFVMSTGGMSCAPNGA